MTTKISHIIRRILRIPEPPAQYEQNYFSDIFASLSDWIQRESQPISRGWTTGAYTTTVRGPLGNASVTSVSTVTAGSHVMVVSAATGTQDGVPWVIAVNDVLDIEPGTAQHEYVLVTNAAGTSITATFANAHDGSGTPFSIVVETRGPQRLDMVNRLVDDLKNAGKLAGHGFPSS